MTASALRPSHLPELELCTPTSVEELTRLVADGFCPMGGGSDVLLAALQRGEPRHLVSTLRVAELGRLDIGDREITIGGAVTLARLVRHPELRSGIAAIAEAAQKVGSVQLRNSATLIGNLCTASPAGDTIAGLFVHNAIVDTVDSSGTRRAIGVRDFLLGPGQTALVDSEIVTGVRVERLGQGEGSAYRRFTERNAIDLAFASVAARVMLEADGETIRSVDLALGAVGPTVIDASAVADSLLGHAPITDRVEAVADAASEVCSPISDHRCSADYRRQLIRVLVVEAIDRASARARGLDSELGVGH